MISQNDIKLFASLKLKKFRQQHQLFLVEGSKMIEELLKSDFSIVNILGSESAFSKTGLLNHKCAEIVNEKALERISNMKSPSDIIAIAKIPQTPSKLKLTSQSILIDDIQDPGNLGTIIRTAHWFGFKQIICSENSVDLFNHKVIQASMGAVFKIAVSYQDLEKVILKLNKNDIKVLGTFLKGQSIYDFPFSKNDVFVLGNEGQGISKSIEKLINKKITIPNFSKGEPTESLNIAAAAAVVCSEMAKSFKK